MSLLESWKEEKQSAYLYRILANYEAGSPREKLFNELANHAEGQALTWASLHEKKMGAGEKFEYKPDIRVKIVAKALHVFGPRRLKTVLAAMKIRGVSVYSGSKIQLTGHTQPMNVQDIGARHQIKGGGGNLRAAVFGINDGLVSTASLILGVAAASSQDPKIIVMTGASGLLAGALSMASGEYVSVRSQRELLEYQLDLERAELEEYPEEEAEELALIYEARGIKREEAIRVAKELISDPERALDTLAREELGLDPSDLGSPWGASVSSFFSFALGGIIPLSPYLFGMAASLTVTVCLTGAALFLSGVVVSFFSGRSFMYSGLRMLVIGGGAGLISYLIGIAVKI